jgi:WhiB family redox-sensing transcriptional regulator
VSIISADQGTSTRQPNTTPAVPTWHDQAACAGSDPTLFYPTAAAHVRKAKQICRDCPVWAACLADALTRKENWGVWGGLTDVERRALTLRERRRFIQIGAAS